MAAPSLEPIDWDEALDSAEDGANGVEPEAEQTVAHAEEEATETLEEDEPEVEDKEELSVPEESEGEAEDDVPEVEDRDPAWYRKNTQKLRASRRQEREKNAALEARIKALESAQSQPQTQQSPTKVVASEEVVFQEVLDELGIDPEIESESMVRMAQMMARERMRNNALEGSFVQSRHEKALASLNSDIDSIVADNPDIARTDLMHAAARGEDLSEYVADRRMAFDQYLAAKGYSKGDAASAKKASPKAMPVEKRATGSRKKAPAKKTGMHKPPEWRGKGIPKLDLDDDLDAIFDARR